MTILQDDGNRLDLLLRIYGIGVDQFVVRNNEILSAFTLGEVNIAPKIVSVFKNGRFEQFLDSFTLKKDDLRDPGKYSRFINILFYIHIIVISTKIAQEMAKIHKIIPSRHPKESEADLWNKITSFLGFIEASPKSALLFELVGFDLESLKLEFAELKKRCLAVESEIFFCHNDV